MWRDLENNVSNTSTTEYGRSGTSENNFGKYDFELEAVPNIEVSDFVQMLEEENRLNCTQSILLTPYFRKEAKKIRDQAKKSEELLHFWPTFFLGLGKGRRGRL